MQPSCHSTCGPNRSGCCHSAHGVHVQALSNTVWAFSKLDVVDADLFARIVDQVLAKLPKFNAQNIANTVRPAQGKPKLQVA